MGYFHVGNDSRSDVVTNEQGKTVQIMAPGTKDHAEKIDVIAPLIAGIDVDADKFVIGISEEFLDRIAALEARDIKVSAISPVENIYPTTIIEQREPSEELKAMADRINDLSSEVNAAREYMDRVKTAMERQAEFQASQVEERMAAANERIEKEAAKAEKAERDIATLCELAGEREAEIQAIAKRHARLFAIVCAVALIMGLIAIVS
jgi:hypothetical protein